MPPDKLSIGAAEELTEKSDADVRKMIEGIIAAKPALGTLERKIADLYAAAMDETAIEARGIAPLLPHLARIKAVKTRDELTRLMGVIGYNSRSASALRRARPILMRTQSGFHKPGSACRIVATISPSAWRTSRFASPIARTSSICCG